MLRWDRTSPGQPRHRSKRPWPDPNQPGPFFCTRGGRRLGGLTASLRRCERPIVCAHCAITIRLGFGYLTGAGHRWINSANPRAARRGCRTWRGDLNPRAKYLTTAANAFDHTVKLCVLAIDWVVRITHQVILRRHLIGARLAVADRCLR
jgi:hypothetical protein